MMEGDGRRKRCSEGSRQLAFDLTRDPSYDEDEFLVSPSNESAYVAIASWPTWPSHTHLLVGPPGSGKSHLAAIWATRSGARFISAGRTDAMGDWRGPVVALVEDWDRMDYDQASLFHLVNMVHETNGWILMTSRAAPTAANIIVPDLLSRLRLAPVINVYQPDTKLMKAIVVKLFADRQIHIDEDVISYIALHCERTLNVINEFITAVDQDALSAGRRITRALAAQTMARLTSSHMSLGEEIQENP